MRTVHLLCILFFGFAFSDVTVDSASEAKKKSEQEASKLKLAFNVIDKDKTNRLSFGELKPLVQLFKPKVTKDEIKALIMADNSGKKLIKKKSFLEAFSKKISESNGLLSIFKDSKYATADAVTGTDLLTLLLTANISNKAKMQCILGLLDADSDKKISLKELETKLGATLAKTLQDSIVNKDDKFAPSDLKTFLKKKPELVSEIVKHLTAGNAEIPPK